MILAQYCPWCSTSLRIKRQPQSIKPMTTVGAEKISREETPASKVKVASICINTGYKITVKLWHNFLREKVPSSSNVPPIVTDLNASIYSLTKSCRFIYRNLTAIWKKSTFKMFYQLQLFIPHTAGSCA